jgi:hypothetical protein
MCFHSIIVRLVYLSVGVAMKAAICAILFLTYILASIAQQTEIGSSSDDVVFTIEHRLDGQSFVPRTKINLVKKPDGKQALVFPEKNGVFGDDISPLKRMLDENTLYTIRIQSHSGNSSSAPILSSIPVVSSPP